MPTFSAPAPRQDGSGQLDDRSFSRLLRYATSALVLSLGIPVLVLLALVIFHQRAADSVNHTDRVIELTTGVENKLVRMQTSFRGYRLATEEKYLEPYLAGRGEVRAALDELAGLVADNPPQVEAARQALKEVNAWIAFVDQQITDIREGRTDVRDPLFLKQGVPLFDATQSRLAKFASVERKLHGKRAGTLRLITKAILIGFCAAALIGIPLFTLWIQRLLRRVTTSYRSSLTTAERRAGELQVTLRSIGDAVVSTDKLGRVEFLNPAAETLTGWAQTEALGKPLSEIFDIYNEYTGAPAENPVDRVLRENIVVGLANHTALRSRGGMITPIEDSAAPIRDDQGAVNGVILVFHAVSEKREAERLLRDSERRFRFLNELGETTRTLVDPVQIMDASTRLLGTHLHVSRCAYADVQADGESFSILQDYTDGCESTRGDYRLSLFGPRAVEELRQGRTLLIRNVDTELAPDEGANMFNAIGIKAIICCPLVKEGKLRALMAVHQTTPRNWTESEADLLEEVVERCWATTERSRAEAALNASETIKSAILDTSLDGFILMDHEGLIVDWNVAAERIFGAPREQVVDKELASIIVPERLRDAHRKGLARYMTTGDSRILGKRLELPTLRADGSEFPCELAITHIPGTDPALFAGYVRDITERKQNESALHAATEKAEAGALAAAESAERFRLLAGVVSLQVWTARLDGDLDFANQQCADYFGADTETQILGSRWAQFVHEEDLPHALTGWKNSLATGNRYETEFRLRRFDGEYRWFLARAEAMRETDGRIVRWFGTNTDIHALKMAQSRAERASRAKDDFLATLSHELRTPLTPVLMAAAVLREDQRLPDEAREQLAMMERNIALEARLIDDLLDLTSISRGKLHLRPEPCDAHSLIGRSLEIVLDDLKAKDIAFEQIFTARRSGLRADPARFLQVMWNLLRNAVKFTPRGGRITIRTSENTADDGSVWLRIDVADSGVGIDPGSLDLIFQPFEQGTATGDHQFGGVGLGLAIARAIVDLHGGKISGHSEGVNRGATFTVEMPGAGEPPQGIEDAGLFEPAAPAGESTGPSGKAAAPLRLLLVEDHEATLKILSRLLMRAGHHVVTAGNTTDAIAAAAAGKFDLVISDLGLPDGTGTQLMIRLRNEHGLRGIALSGYGMPEDIARTREAGFVAHLVKPVRFSELTQALASIPRAEQRDGTAREQTPE